LAVGLSCGTAYVAFDLASEGRIGAGTLHGAWASLHDVIDHLLPPIAGALFGVALHYLRVRSRLAGAEEAANRAESLRIRLQKVERDQAVWVVAAAVLHELNNPLHAIVLALDELAEAQDDPAQRADLVSRARVQAERALSKLRALRSMRNVGEPELESVSLVDLVRPLADDVGSLAREEGLTVRVVCNESVRANADPEYVRTIVENLLDNGLQALREQGGKTITVSVNFENDHAVVRVTGDAVSSGPLDESVFEPLHTTKPHGLGLGLAISRALARAMRGDVLLDSSHGNAFRLELPAEGPA
jgi:polar amino acid transport system substrate-binding protein